MKRKVRSRRTEHRAVVRAHRKFYDALLEFQGGGCAICGKPPNPERRHALDHDHKTMLLRGILCTVCNRRLTSRLTADWLRKAADYLDNPPFAKMQEGEQ